MGCLMRFTVWRFPFWAVLFSAVWGWFSLATAAPGLLGDNNGANSHPHNLSSSSTAAVHSSTEDRICVFCHAPHGTSSSGALWNRDDSTETFPLYAGAETLSDNPGVTGYDDTDQSAYPNGSTRLCLSCHDGVTAIAEVINGGSLDPTGLGSKDLTDLIGTSERGAAAIIDLSNAHPVSFVFDAAALALYDTTPYPDVPTFQADLSGMLAGLLDSQNRLQCGGCHDPHTDTYNPGVYDLPMWRNYTGDDVADYDAVCESCHINSPSNINHN